MEFVSGTLLVGSAVMLVGYLWRRTPFLPSLEGKHVFITGGSTGIGYAIAKRALLQGAYVTVTGRSLSNLQKAQDSLLEEIGDGATRVRIKVRKSYFSGLFLTFIWPGRECEIYTLLRQTRLRLRYMLFLYVK